MELEFEGILTKEFQPSYSVHLRHRSYQRQKTLFLLQICEFGKSKF